MALIFICREYKLNIYASVKLCETNTNAAIAIIGKYPCLWQ